MISRNGWNFSRHMQSFADDFKTGSVRGVLSPNTSQSAPSILLAVLIRKRNLSTHDLLNVRKRQCHVTLEKKPPVEDLVTCESEAVHICGP